MALWGQHSYCLKEISVTQLKQHIPGVSPIVVQEIVTGLKLA